MSNSVARYALLVMSPTTTVLFWLAAFVVGGIAAALANRFVSDYWNAMVFGLFVVIVCVEGTLWLLE